MRLRQIVLIALIGALVVVTTALLGPALGPASATPFATISAGGEHNCVLSADGGLKCWGSNSPGELGNEAAIGDLSSTPVDGTAFGADIKSVGAGMFYTCAVSSAGAVQCAGANYSGQLGDGKACGILCSTPVDVVGLASGVEAVTTGYIHACALTDSGALKCWGVNNYGQLGDGTSQGSSAPVGVVGLSGPTTAVSVALWHTCALSEAGGVQCWGHNDYGQLGNGTDNGNVANATPQDVIGLESGVAGIAVGETHSCALTSAGGVKCWGWNASGQLGDGTTTQSSVPVDVVGLDSGVAAISADGAHTCVVMTSGAAKCWGWNGFGQLGVPSSGFQDIRTTPVDVCSDAACAQPLADVVAIAPGGLHTCALRGSGTVKCWGYNGHGQLGNATTVSSNTPVHLAIDSDQDGCWDGVEAEGDALLGGRRNPENFWDLYDVWTGEPPARGRAVDIGDLGAVVARFGATRETPPTEEEALAEALTPPADATGYHAAFDRGAPIEGGELWDLSPPDGSIGLGDIAAVVAQFGHSCA